MDPLCNEIERCRVCSSAELHPVIDMGSQYIASLFPKRPLSSDLERRFPLEVVRCAAQKGCGLVQLRHTVSPAVMYSEYGYRSGTNEMMRANLAQITERIEKVVPLDPGDVVVDIGCNDGTLLSSYRSTGIKRVGMDPSDAVESIKDDRITVVRDFFSHSSFLSAARGEKAKVVTTIAMFYDLDTPAKFVDDVRRCLAEDGLWVIELAYLPLILRAHAFDGICHEHLEYYALGPLEWLVNQQGLRIHDAETNDVNGGSIRVFVRPLAAGDPPSDALDRVNAIKEWERSLELRSDAPYDEFREETAAIRSELLDLLRQLVGQGRKVYGYGASTKGNTLLQFCGLDATLIAKIADRNASKWGTTTIGTNIPIISEEEARSDQPDYFLILPWHFLEGFIEREKEFLERGGRFIVPLPRVRMLSSSDV